MTTGAVLDRTVDELRVRVFADAQALAQAAAADAADTLTAAIDARGFAQAMFASGNSQLAFLDELAALGGVDWSQVVGFHMDEYVGIGGDQPASFCRYMRERVVEGLGIRNFHYLDGSADPEAEARRYSALLGETRLDLCCLGIGENGHLAFNDPPDANFDDPVDVKVVTLHDASRRQQVGEGHFRAVDDVPTRAITVTIPALLRAGRVLAIVPEGRKAEPVRRALEGAISADCPASILRRQAHATLYLDRQSSSRVRASS